MPDLASLFTGETAIQLTGVLDGIMDMVPVVLPVVIGFIAFRKAWGFLTDAIHSA